MFFGSLNNDLLAPLLEEGSVPLDLHVQVLVGLHWHVHLIYVVDYRLLLKGLHIVVANSSERIQKFHKIALSKKKRFYLRLGFVQVLNFFPENHLIKPEGISLKKLYWKPKFID